MPKRVPLSNNTYTHSIRLKHFIMNKQNMWICAFFHPLFPEPERERERKK